MKLWDSVYQMGDYVCYINLCLIIRYYDITALGSNYYDNHDVVGIFSLED